MDYLDTINLDEDIDKLYELMNNDTLSKEHQNNIKLNKLRNDNHKRYYKINMIRLKNLPEEFKPIVDDITELYKKLVLKDILNDSEKGSIETKKILDEIYLKIKRVESMIKTTIKELDKYNDEKQSEFSIVDLKNLDVDEKSKKNALNLYNELVLYSADMKKDIYENLKYQIVRKNYIDDIIRIINKGKDTKQNIEKIDKTNELNKELNKVINETNDKVQYLSDLVPQDDNEQETLNSFLNFYNKILDYDDTNYDNVKQTLDILTDKDKFDIYINNLKQDINFKQELNNKESDSKKVELLNIKNYLDYIESNYIDTLDKPRKLVVEDIYNKLKNKDIDTNVIIKNLSNITNYIWESTITGTKQKENFYILCSNNQFVEPKTEAILLTSNILKHMDDYLDYQIGFICDYSKNILYITHSGDIMDAKIDNLSKLKTPKQIEQEYINLNIMSKISLDGYKTKIIGVYFIDDGDEVKYSKALELSNNYKLPLIILKK